MVGSRLTGRATATLATDPRAQVVAVALLAVTVGAWGGPLGWVAVALVAGFSVSGSY